MKNNLLIRQEKVKIIAFLVFYIQSGDNEKLMACLISQKNITLCFLEAYFGYLESNILVDEISCQKTEH